MMHKRLFWLIFGFIVLVVGAFFLFRYGFLPSVPKENPVQITAEFAVVEGVNTYRFTEQQKIEEIMKQIRSAPFHRKMIRVQYLGYPFIFTKITFQYQNETYIYTAASGNQFYLTPQGRRWPGPLYEMESQDYNDIVNYFRQICEITS